MADSVGKLNLKLAVDGSEFGPGLQRETAHLERFANQTRATSDRVARTFQEMGNASQNVLAGLGSGGTTGAVNALGDAIVGLASKGSVMGAVITAGLTLVTAGLYALKKQFDETAQSLNDINRFSRLLGEGGQATQTLKNVFDAAGVEDAQATLLRFFDKIGDMRAQLANGGNGGPTGDALRRIGLDPAAIANASPARAFEQIILALNQTSNAYDRAAASQAIFSRSFVELQPIIEGGGRALAAGRLRTERSGADGSSLAAMQEARRINRELDTAYGGQLSGRISQTWQSVVAGISLASANARNSTAQFFEALTGAQRPALQGNQQIAESFRAIRAAAQAAAADQAAFAEREKKIAEETRARESRIQSMLNSGRSALERFQSIMHDANFANDADRGNLLAGGFRQLESALGLGGNQSLALDGTAANSIEAARLIADRKTRQRNGVDDPQNRILQVLQIANELHERQINESEAIAQALSRVPGLGIAPINGRGGRR